MCVAFVVLWFGANYFVYYSSVKMFVTEENREYMDSIPEQFVLAAPPAEGIPIELMGLQMNLPFEGEYISNVSVLFNDHKLRSVMFSYITEERWVTFNVSNAKDKVDRSFLYTLCIKDYNHSYYNLIRNVYYAKPDDFSFWNLPCNISLTSNIVLKSMSDDNNMKSYELQTPNLTGFMKNNYHIANSLTFADVDFKLYSNTINVGIDGLEGMGNDSLALSIIASIKPAGGSLPIPSTEQFPEELVLVLEMDKEGVTIDRLESLRKVMQAKNNNKTYISYITEEIEALKAEQ